MRKPTRPTRAAVACLLASCWLGMPGCSSTWVLDKGWHEVRSENFTITSDMSVERAKKLAEQLELFRAAVLFITNTRSVDANIPTRVFFFAREATFRSFRPSNEAAGYFHQTPRANFVAMAEFDQIDSARVLRHEYVHFLLHNGSRRIYPRWYDEGFAELLSTAQQVGAHVAVGMVPRDRIPALTQAPWVPIALILSDDGAGRVPGYSFYAESWALLHYLSRDLKSAAALGPSVEIYLDQVEAGADFHAACQAAFGMSTDKLDEEVRMHLRNGSFTPIGVREDRLAWSRETTVRSLPRAEVAERLGELSFALGNTGDAGDLFQAALTADPGLARAHAGLGSVLARREEWNEAEAQFARAVELAPDDPLNLIDQGEYWLSRAQREEDAELRREQLAGARALLLRAIDLDEWRPEAWLAHGATFLVEGEDPALAVEWLEQVLRLLPSSTYAQLSLAEAYVAIHRQREARVLLARILGWEHDGEVADKARELASQLDPVFEPGVDPDVHEESR